MNKNQDLSKRWIKLPDRRSKEWYSLMGAITKNFKFVIANILISNPTREGFHNITRGFLKTLQYNQETSDVLTYLIGNTYFYKGYGLGVVLRDLQPYLLPWVKIAKHKIAKEFKIFLIEASKKHNIRHNVNMAELRIRTPSSKFTYLTICHLTPKFKKSDWYIPTDKRFLTNNLLKAFPVHSTSGTLAICRTQEGKAVLGITHEYISIDKYQLVTKRIICCRTPFHQSTSGGSEWKDFRTGIKTVTPILLGIKF